MATLNIKDLLRPRVLNRKYFKYLERTDQSGNVDGGRSAYKYCLKHLLHPNFSPCELYLGYFQSYTRRERCKERISRFYRVFTEYVFLHSLLSESKMKVESFVQEMLGRRGASDKQLQKMTKELVQKCFSKYGKLLKNRQRKVGDVIKYEQVREIKSLMSELLSQFFREVDNSIEQIRAQQFLPKQFVSRQEIMSYVMGSFEKLRNLRVLTSKKKKKMIEKMRSELKNYVLIQYKNQNKQERDDHYLVMEMFSNQTEPVITPLCNYFAYKKQERKNVAEGKRRLQATAVPLVKSLLFSCSHFHRITNLVYPFISSRDILFDQKSLKPIFRQTSLIYHALGVTNSQQGSIQLELAFNATPQSIQFEKSEFEFGEAEAWALDRRYYVQQKVSVEGRELAESELLSQLQRLQRLEGCPALSAETVEKVHVWRLFCICYHILTEGRNLIQDVYNKEMIRSNPNEPPAFYYSKYRQVLRKFHGKVASDRGLILEYLGSPPEIKNQKEQVQSLKKVEKKRFDFRLAQLLQLLNVRQADDPLAPSILSPTRSELWVRGVLFKQISATILSDSYFKRFLNAKKYLLIFSTSIMSLTYELVLPIVVAKGKMVVRRQVVEGLKDEKNLVFEKEKKRKIDYIKSTFEKLQNYSERQDSQGQYMRAHSSFIDKIKQINKDYQILLDLQLKLESQEKKIEADGETDASIFRKRCAYFVSDCKEVCELVRRSFNAASEILGTIIHQEFFHRVQMIENFQKIDGSVSNQILLYYNKKLFYLLRAFYTLSPDNWRQYQNLVLPVLVDLKSLNGSDSPKKVEKMQVNEIYQCLDKFDYVGSIIGEESGQFFMSIETFPMKLAQI